MKVKIDYPIEHSFRCRSAIGKESNPNKIRASILRRELKKLLNKGVDASPCHRLSDYVVEKVVRDKRGNELWIIGS